MADNDHIPRQDPLTRWFLIVVAIVLVIGILLAVRIALSQRGAAKPASSTASSTTSQATAQATAADGLAAIGARIRTGVDELLRTIRDMQSMPPEPTAPAPPQPRANAATSAPAGQPAAQPVARGNDPLRTYQAAAAPPAPQVAVVPADGRWSYDVFFGPGWHKNGQLRYSTHRRTDPSAKSGAPDKVGASMSWAPNSGQPTTWDFGIIEADHPSHGNTRFPGFFMHPPYLPQSLQAGNRILWELPWQGGGSAQARRFDMRVVGWESVTVPAGEFTAVHLEGKLQYVDKDAIKAEVRYAIWYAPRARQVVRVLWLGRSPDESSAEMIAELASFNAP